MAAISTAYKAFERGYVVKTEPLAETLQEPASDAQVDEGETTDSAAEQNDGASAAEAALSAAKQNDGTGAAKAADAAAKQSDVFGVWGGG